MTAPFDHLEESPLTEQPLFYVEPRDRDPAPEIDRQARFKVMVRKAGLRWAAVPNAHDWGQKAKNRAVKEGVWWGFPDGMVLGARRFIAFPEFKNGTASPAAHQIECLNILHRMGFPVAVIRTPERGMDWLAEAGAFQ